jgi:hypothetical protein
MPDNITPEERIEILEAELGALKTQLSEADLLMENIHMQDIFFKVHANRSRRGWDGGPLQKKERRDHLLTRGEANANALEEHLTFITRAFNYSLKLQPLESKDGILSILNYYVGAKEWGTALVADTHAFAGHHMIPRALTLETAGKIASWLNDGAPADE